MAPRKINIPDRISDDNRCSIMQPTMVLVCLFSFLFCAVAQVSFTRTILDSQFTGNSSGSWGDYNNDGFPDLYICNESGANRLYRNNGDFSFSIMSVSEVGDIVTNFGSSEMATWGDFNNDGYLDLFIANDGQNNRLFRNDGGFFTLVAGPVSNDGGNSEAAAWGDYDGDGLLDLFVANDANQDNFLYHNNGGGNFSAITGLPPQVNHRQGDGCVWIDFDRDDDVDLLVIADNDNGLYENLGGGNFVLLNNAISNNAAESKGASWGDYNNDGYPDLFITNHSGVDFLFRNDSGTGFTRILDLAPALNPGPALSSDWGDFDNDGDLDLFVTLDSNTEDNHLYVNESGSFIQADSLLGRSLESAHSCAWIDIENDGDLDLFVANGSGVPNVINRNVGGNSNGNFIYMQLIGTLSNRSAIGTRVTVKANFGGRDVVQYRDIVSQTGYESQSSLEVEFGVGDAMIVDSINITWPDGSRLLMPGWPVNRIFTVTQPGGQGNQDPFVRNAIDDTAMVVGEFLSIDLEDGPVFGDPDGDKLFYSVISDNDSVVSASIDFGFLNLEAFNPGTARIFLTAEDGLGGRVTFPFTVTVPVNQPPVVNNPLPDTTMVLGPVPLFIDLVGLEIFQDPEDDTLFFDAFSSNDSIAVAYVDNNRTLTIEAFANGICDIMVVAEDPFSNADSLLFQLTVNLCPFQQLGLPDLILLEGEQQFLELDSFFVEPDADDFLSYTLDNDNPVVAEVMLSGDTLYVTGLSPGVANIAVSAVDRRDCQVSDTFEVAVIEGLLVEHTPGQPVVGQNLPVELIVIDSSGSGIEYAEVLYRTGLDLDFVERLPMALIDGIYVAEIPHYTISQSGLDYFIEIVDINGQIINLPYDSGTYSPPVLIPEGVTTIQPASTGEMQNNYRLISFPVDIDDPRPAVILEDDLGSYDDRAWRFLEPLGNDEFIDYPDIDSIFAGQAYWLLSRRPDLFVDSGPAQTIPINTPFTIPLQDGWNYIGSPFYFPFSTNRASTLGNNEVVIFYYDEDGWQVPTGSLLAFRGYAIATISGEADLLILDPTVSTGARSTENQPLLKTGGDRDWQINIRATARQHPALDIANGAGVSANARKDWDRLDLPEPPVIGGYVSLAFPHADWGMVFKRFSRDLRPPLGEGEIWEIDVTTNIDDLIDLSFENLANVPPQYKIILIDELLLTTVDLRKNSRNTLAAHRAAAPRRLQLVVGKAGFISDVVAALPVVPTRFSLDQNFPNPFNPSTTLRFGLPEQADVTLTIYNVLGQKVSSLLNKSPLPAGYHSAIWDGRDGAGRKVASGLYLLTLQSESFSKTIKMLLVD